MLADVPWLTGKTGDSCFICENETENVDHFFFACPDFRVYFNLLWSKLETKILTLNVARWNADCQFYQKPGSPPKVFSFTWAS